MASFSSSIECSRHPVHLFRSKERVEGSRELYQADYRTGFLGNFIASWARSTMRYPEMVTIMLTVMLNVVQGTLAVQHKVGATLGWNYPPTEGSSFFANWAAQNTFHVGDSLSFEYIAGTHNVVQVDRSDYDACTSYRPMQLYSANKVVVNLLKPGTYYYICGIKGHCELGMKVALTVS